MSFESLTLRFVKDSHNISGCTIYRLEKTLCNNGVMVLATGLVFTPGVVEESILNHINKLLSEDERVEELERAFRRGHEEGIEECALAHNVVSCL